MNKNAHVIEIISLKVKTCNELMEHYNGRKASVKSVPGNVFNSCIEDAYSHARRMLEDVQEAIELSTDISAPPTTYVDAESPLSTVLRDLASLYHAYSERDKSSDEIVLRDPLQRLMDSYDEWLG